jgi:tetratricopeptide (TPR) repeat protein
LADENIEKAILSLQNIDSNEAKYNLGNLYYSLKEYQLALKSYQEVKSSNPIFKSKLYYNMGNTFVKLSNIQEAKRYYLFALRLYYDEEYLYNYLAIREILDMPKESQVNSYRAFNELSLFKKLESSSFSLTFEEQQILNGKN